MMNETNIVCISNNIQQLQTIAEELKGLEASVVQFQTVDEALPLIEHENTLVVVDIIKDFSLEFIQQQHSEMLWIGLVDQKNYPLLFEHFNHWHYAKLLTSPWQYGQLESAVETVVESTLVSSSTHLDLAVAEQRIESLEEELSRSKLDAKRQQSELEQIFSMLEENLKKVQSAKEEMIPIISALINLRINKPFDDAIPSAQLAMNIAKKIGLKEKEVKDIYTAALLHNIGQVALPDKILKTPYNSLSETQKKEFDRLVLSGQAILNSIPMFENVAVAIRNLYESYDGSGFPDKLKGKDIPRHSRILLPAIDYFELQKKDYFNSSMSAKQAEAYIVEHKGIKYDPSIVEHLVNALREISYTQKRDIITVPLTQATPGMELASSIRVRDSISLLTPGRVLSPPIIEKLFLIQKDLDESIKLQVYET